LEPFESAPGITEVIKFGFYAGVTFQGIPGLDKAPDSPHPVGCRTPHLNLFLEDVHHLFPLAFGDGRICMCDVRLVEVAPLVKGRVSSRIKDMRSGSVVISGPFYKVVRNIKGCWVWTSIFEINDDNLGKTKVSLR
jgi:hypothetical protein